MYTERVLGPCSCSSWRDLSLCFLSWCFSLLSYREDTITKRVNSVLKPLSLGRIHLIYLIQTTAMHFCIENWEFCPTSYIDRIRSRPPSKPVCTEGKITVANNSFKAHYNTDLEKNLNLSFKLGVFRPAVTLQPLTWDVKSQTVLMLSHWAQLLSSSGGPNLA